MDSAAVKVFINEIIEGRLFFDRKGRFWKYRKGQKVRAEHKTPLGYLQLRKMVTGKRHHIGAHRMAYRCFKGYLLDGFVVNHKNGIKDDNRPYQILHGNCSQEYAPGLWCPARPVGYFSIKHRFRAAWMVFIGAADVIMWPDATTAYSPVEDRKAKSGVCRDCMDEFGHPDNCKDCPNDPLSV